MEKKTQTSFFLTKQNRTRKTLSLPSEPLNIIIATYEERFFFLPYRYRVAWSDQNKAWEEGPPGSAFCLPDQAASSRSSADNLQVL